MRVEDERKVILKTWKQARHSVLPNSFHSPGRRLQILQRLAAHILIDHLPGSSLAANSSRLRFCRRAPFFLSLQAWQVRSVLLQWNRCFRSGIAFLTSLSGNFRVVPPKY